MAPGNMGANVRGIGALGLWALAILPGCGGGMMAADASPDGASTDGSMADVGADRVTADTAANTDAGPDALPDATVADAIDVPADAPDDVPSADGFVPADHPALPVIVAHGGTVFAHPQLVTITYPGYAYTNQVESLADYMVSSPWLTTVGEEYGVGQGTHLASVHLTAGAPTTIDDSGIGTMVRTKIADGTLPAPGGANADIMYMVFFPATTSISDYPGDVSCDGFYGYHSARTTGGVPYTYAVIPDCNMGIDAITETASHEFIEIATDPYDSPDDAWYVDATYPDPWWIEGGDEVADLCEDETSSNMGGFSLERVWSNRAALTGHPCVPAIADTTYFNVYGTPGDAPDVAAGSTVTFTLTGWSTAPVPDWQLSLDVSDGSDIDFAAMNPTLSADTINNGQSVTLTLTVPAGAASNSGGGVRVYSGGYRYWPVLFNVL